MDTMFRDLDEKETEEFKQWARKNYTPGEPIQPIWHPVVRKECVEMNKEQDKALEHISRIDQEHKSNHGWYVRIHHKGEYHRFFFSDRTWGGREEALEEAKKKREELLEWRNKDPQRLRTKEGRFYIRKGWNNSTGVTGVCRIVPKTGSPYYAASVSITKNNPVNKRVTVSVHGERGAFIRAVYFRRNGLIEAHGEKFDEKTFNEQVQEYLKKLKEEEGL